MKKPRTMYFFKNTCIKSLQRYNQFAFPHSPHSALLQLQHQAGSLCRMGAHGSGSSRRACHTVLLSPLFFERTPKLNSCGFRLSYTRIPGPTKVTNPMLNMIHLHPDHRDIKQGRFLRRKIGVHLLDVLTDLRQRIKGFAPPQRRFI